MSGPYWVHVGRNGAPLPTIENVSAMLDWFCIDHAAIQLPMISLAQIAEYRQTGVSASAFDPIRWMVELRSKCASVELMISINDLREYTHILLMRALGDGNDSFHRHVAALIEAGDIS